MTDAAKLPLMLTELRMPTIGRLWQDLGATADKEGWGAARFLAALCEHEIAERSQRRIGRHLAESGLQPGKTLETFDFAAVPSVRKAHVLALATGATWLEAGANILIFGPSEPASYCPPVHVVTIAVLFAAGLLAADAASVVPSPLV